MPHVKLNSVRQLHVKASVNYVSLDFSLNANNSENFLTGLMLHFHARMGMIFTGATFGRMTNSSLSLLYGVSQTYL